MSDAMIPEWATEKQDWIVKIFDRSGREQHAEVVLVNDLTFAELQLHCLGNWPNEYEANRVIASSLTHQWQEESET